MKIVNFLLNIVFVQLKLICVPDVFGSFRDLSSLGLSDPLPDFSSMDALVTM
jgi:hypothetical protein